MPIFTMGGGQKSEQSKTVTPNAAGFTVTSLQKQIDELRAIIASMAV